MAAHGILERILWFDARIRAGRFPNASQLAERFELSTKTAQRDIAFFRDRLFAPLEYHRPKRGYAYSDSAFTLPLLWVNQDQLLALLLARQLLRGGGDPLARALERLADQVLALAADNRLDTAAFDRLFSAGWSGYTPVAAEVFHAALTAITTCRPLAFHYTSPIDGRGCRRSAEPHHLQLYQGEWVLLAWCRLRQAWRKFLLARMGAVQTLEESFAPRPESQWRPQIEGAFGIFQGTPRRWVHLRFAPARARYIRGQLWHAEQRQEEQADGSLDLRLPVADLREIRLKVLQFGSEVEVFAPADLRADIATEARRMLERYGTD